MVVLVAVWVLTLGACSALPFPGKGNHDESPEPERRSTAYAEAQDPHAEPPAPQVANARSGGTLRVLSDTTPPTFDPTRIHQPDTTAIMELVTRGLTQTTYEDGKPVLVPDMATDLGRPNKNFTRWEFTLRDGLTFRGGRDAGRQDDRRQDAQTVPLDASLRLASGVRSDSAGKGESRGIHPASIGDRSVRIRP